MHNPIALYTNGSPGNEQHKGTGSQVYNKEFFLGLLKKENLPASFLCFRAGGFLQMVQPADCGVPHRIQKPTMKNSNPSI